MASLTLNLPDSIYQKLKLKAHRENVSLTEYLFSLAVSDVQRDEISAVPYSEMLQRQKDFEIWQQNLTPATEQEFDTYFASADLESVAETASPTIIEKFEERLRDARQRSK